MRSFLYKMSEFVLFLNKNVCFALSGDQTMKHLYIKFYERNSAKSLLERVVKIFSRRINTSFINATDCHIWKNQWIFSR